MTAPAAKSSPFLYIADLDALREKLARAERDQTLMGRVWHGLKHRAQAAPDGHGWFTPFVALVTGQQADIDRAKQQIKNYVATFDAQQFGMGVHFHFWCFAFPHARWALYFKWLETLGVWTEEERRPLLDELAMWQFTNFFSGMRMKPEPECVDNQSLALSFSNALFGRLFSDSPEIGALARRMALDGFRRLPDMLGGFPPSGYSGEGSAYMAGVVGPAIPYVVELLEAELGGDWFNRELPPYGGSAAAVLRMVARSLMPNGLMLPWDDYGYMFPPRSSLAYGAHRTGEAWYLEQLETANWGFDIGVGWGYDDLVWSLIWWPEKKAKSAGIAFPSWAEPTLGGALVSDNADLYLMQMWDHATPKLPLREHVNPNSLVLAAYGSPITVDGSSTTECPAFKYDDTWLERSGMGFQIIRINFGRGCAGSHNVLLVDGWEAMRPDGKYEQAELVEFDAAGKILCGDVTPLYREKWPDTIRVRRRSRLCDGRFWLIEDLAAFRAEHRVTSRWIFRPEVDASGPGVTVETAEGVRLRLLPLLGPDVKDVRRVKGYPAVLEGESQIVDFKQTGPLCRWLWLAFPEPTRREHEDITAGWTAAGDEQGDWNFGQAAAALSKSSLNVPVEMPPYMITDAPVIATWWYRRRVKVPAQPGKVWLRLPRRLFEPRLWIDGREIDLKKSWLLANLMPLDVEIPAGARGEIEIVLRTQSAIKPYSGKYDGCFEGRAQLLVPTVESAPITASYRNGIAEIARGGESWRIPHELMPVEDRP